MAMPRAESSSGAPIPDSISNCGELIAPPHSRTSRRASTAWVAPLSMYSTPIARVPSNRTRGDVSLHLNGKILRDNAGCR